jgi:hypothetical protein
VWCKLFKDLDVTALERALGNWVMGYAAASGHVAIDGKRLRGSATARSPGTHLVAAFSASLQGVIGQLRVAPEANEITAALELLKTLPLKGVTITGDAIFTQRAIYQAIVDGSGHYFFTVKGNQPALKADIEQAFRPFPPTRRYGLRRLTSGVPKRSRKATAGSRPARSKPPNRQAFFWRLSGPVWRSFAASPATDRTG